MTTASSSSNGIHEHRDDDEEEEKEENKKNHTQQKRMERITRRDSVSVGAKKSTKNSSSYIHVYLDVCTQNPYRFSISTGTRELNIMCASFKHKHIQTSAGARAHTQKPSLLLIHSLASDASEYLLCALTHSLPLYVHIFICVYSTCIKHITNGEMIFCLSASHICQQSVLIRCSLFPCNASVCIIFALCALTID